MKKTLFPDQVETLNKARKAYKDGYKSVLLLASTGFGKSVVAAEVIENAIARGHIVWFLVHRRELVRNISKTLWDNGIPHSFIASGFPYDPSASVQVCSVGTLIHKLDKVIPCTLGIVDEAHHTASTTYTTILDYLPNALWLGLTATPWRGDGIGLGHWYQTMVQAPPMSWLIENKRLSQYKIYAPPAPDLTGIKSVDGDYVKGALAKAMDKPKITGDAISHYQELCNGKRAVVFCVSIEHSKNVARQFQEAGIPAAHIDGTMDDERDRIFEAFERGEILVLCNVDLISEGVDVPAIEAVILLRPTKSLTHYLQSVGRALRLAEGKLFAIILDHAGNSLTHGMPDDDREWTLKDREKKKKGAQKSEVTVIQCPECWHVYRPAQKCPQCGHAAPVMPRRVEQVDGKLEEVIKAEKKEARREQGKAQTYEDLLAIERARGYKHGWARNVWQSRKGRR